MTKDEYDTPTGLEPKSDGVNEWVRFQLLKIHERVKTIERIMDDCVSHQEAMDKFIMKTEVRLAEGAKTFKTLDKQIQDLKTIRKNNNNPGNSITFKWLVEKLGTPVITSVITAILVAALIYWITGTP